MDSNSEKPSGLCTTEFVKVKVYGRATVKTITPKSGPNEGKQVKVLSFKAFQTHIKEKGNGQITDSENFESIWFNVSCFEESAFSLADSIKDGMVLYLNGKISKVSYIASDNTTRTSYSFNVWRIAYDFLHVDNSKEKGGKHDK